MKEKIDYQLVQYLYGELSKEAAAQLEKSLHEEEGLRNRLHELYETLLSIDNSLEVFEPPREVVDRILNQARAPSNDCLKSPHTKSKA